MFSRIVALLSHDVWGIYAVEPLLEIVPQILSISPRIEYKNVDFPDPTLPTTPTKLPFSIFNALILKAIGDLLYYYSDNDIFYSLSKRLAFNDL